MQANKYIIKKKKKKKIHNTLTPYKYRHFSSYPNPKSKKSGEFYQTFKGELILMLLKLFQNIKNKDTFKPILYCLDTKACKDTIRKL